MNYLHVHCLKCDKIWWKWILSAKFKVFRTFWSLFRIWQYFERTLADFLCYTTTPFFICKWYTREKITCISLILSWEPKYLFVQCQGDIWWQSLESLFWIDLRIWNQLFDWGPSILKYKTYNLVAPLELESTRWSTVGLATLQPEWKCSRLWLRRWCRRWQQIQFPFHRERLEAQPDE